MKNLFLLVLLLFTTYVQSQIEGSVTDKKGEALPYVNIFIENTYKGTTSNTNGNVSTSISLVSVLYPKN